VLFGNVWADAYITRETIEILLAIRADLQPNRLSIGSHSPFWGAQCGREWRSTGQGDEDIGRPGPWRGEGRYQEKGHSVDESVTKEPQALPTQPVSKPVSQEDYE
jgi:hypothetical protein